MDSYSKPEKRVTRWSSPDFPKHGIVGMICLDKNDMIVLDRISCSIIMIGKEGNQISSYGFKCIPWGMTSYALLAKRMLLSLSSSLKWVLTGLSFEHAKIDGSCDWNLLTFNLPSDSIVPLKS
jgi:hypothetical protein